MNTPPGTKVKLSGIVDIKNGFLLLNDSNTTVLGGEVEHLIEKWELQRVSVNLEKLLELLKNYTLLMYSVFYGDLPTLNKVSRHLDSLSCQS